ncbi:MAG: AbrB/MazE/SpoVT family DNA-binding domain-containing protein [Chloroflexi bacterium]|nr:AbrB/MazE/SpoVT family DNA-binding domain-containing protein [Chloroflexota bacterium]
MTSASAKITRKGQVTIPKKIREKLSASTVYFEVTNDVVTLRPMRDAAGSLAEYAGNATPGISVEEMKERAWEAQIRPYPPSPGSCPPASGGGRPQKRRL